MEYEPFIKRFELKVIEDEEVTFHQAIDSNSMDSAFEVARVVSKMMRRKRDRNGISSFSVSVVEVNEFVVDEHRLIVLDPELERLIAEEEEIERKFREGNNG